MQSEKHFIHVLVEQYNDLIHTCRSNYFKHTLGLIRLKKSTFELLNQWIYKWKSYCMFKTYIVNSYMFCICEYRSFNRVVHKIYCVLTFLSFRGRDTAQILRIRDRARALYIHTDVCPIIFVPGVTIEVKNILERMSDDVSVEDDKSIQWQVKSIEVH